MGQATRHLLIALACLGGSAVHAADLFPVPKGCTAYATAQLRGCQVVHQYRCAGDAPGDQWETYLDGSGPYYSSRIDSETRWMESVDLITGEVDRIDRDTDPASFTTLIQSGRDDFDFTTRNDAGLVTRFKGYDELTGQSVTIDGVVLERTKFDLSAYAEDGAWLWRRTGNQFIHRDWRLFYADTETFENADGDKVGSVSTPVEFDFPGDKGFLAMEPRYDCDVVSAALELP